MKPHTKHVAFLVILVSLCLIGGVAAQQEGLNNTSASPNATTSAGEENAPDLTNAGAEQAVKFINNTTVTTFGNVSGFIPDVGLELVADNFTTAPMMVTTAPGDDTGRLFVVDQIGVVKIVDANGSIAEEPFLDLQDRMVNLSPTYDERGLLSIAFHPDFQQNGKIYAFYSAPLRPEAPEGWSCTNHISEFTVDVDNPDTVNVSSEKILMYIDKSYENHNGGILAFSPVDGYLYISIGDIGKADDVGDGHNPLIGNGQDLTEIYGKILRIDVDGGNMTGAANQSENATGAVNQTGGVANLSGNVTGAVNQTGGAANLSENATGAATNRIEVTEDFRGNFQPVSPTWVTTEGQLYSIPSDNPFATDKPPVLDSYSFEDILPEIYAYGFRNPAFMSFDAGGEHALIISMAGQDLFESVLDVVKGGNYGWNIREGTHCFNPDNPLQPPETCNTTGYQGEPLIGPVAEYGHDVGNVIIGGEIYRGTNLSNFTGRYIFGSWSSPDNFVTPNGSLFVATPPDGWDESTPPASAEELTPEDNAMWTLQELKVTGDPGKEDGRLDEFVRSISRDSDNELYLLTNTVGGPNSSTQTGSLWKFVPAQDVTATTAENQTQNVTGNQTQNVTGNQTQNVTGNQTSPSAPGGGSGAGSGGHHPQPHHTQPHHLQDI